MARTYQWRKSPSYGDVVVVRDDAAQPGVTVVAADRELLADLLNDMLLLADDGGLATRARPADRETDSETDGYEPDWGDLVLERIDDGQVVGIDPERYWDGIATWFRAHGDDPHRWRLRATPEA